MAGISDILKRQVTIPESIEKQLPGGVPKISKVLYAFADSLPSIPRSKNSKAGLPKFREFISSVEEKMPETLPRFSSIQKEVIPMTESKIVETAPILESIEEEIPAGFPVYGADKRGTVDISKLTT